MRHRFIKIGLAFGVMFMVSPKLRRLIFLLIMVGFDMTAMSEGSWDEAIVDVVGPETVASEPFVIKVSS